MRIAAVGDIHVGTDTSGRLAAGLEGIGECADVLLLAGDLTQIGSEEEADCVVRELEVVDVPIVAVLGNHDYHADQTRTVIRVLRRAGITVLDDSAATLELGSATLGVAGAKGFGGGFAGRSAGAFGEPLMRAFVAHTVEIADRLEHNLATLDADVTVALLHYSPVVDTLTGEPPEIHPFLGSYLLAQAIDRQPPDLVLHGHAHRGVERGLTPGGVRVRNVAQPVLNAPFRVYELHGRRAPHAADEPGGAAALARAGARPRT